jgi:hypothetical protein
LRKNIRILAIIFADFEAPERWMLNCNLSLGIPDSEQIQAKAYCAGTGSKTSI